MAEETGTGPEACNTPRIVANEGHRAWSAVTDRKGYRTYEITHRVEVERGVQGPGAALFASGLPETGAMWTEPDFVDSWAFFTQESKVVQVGETTKSKLFDVTQYATNVPTDECIEEGRTDPLQIADRIRVESVEQRKEMVYDSAGYQVINSAWEQFRGPQTEIDDSAIRVYIEQNAGSLELELVKSLLHCVNSTPMWGFAAGAIKLTKFDAERRFSSNCDKYWLRKFIFDVDENLFAKNLLDEATKVLHGRWDQAKGTGCTLTIVADFNGAVTSATLGAGGSGYPRSAIVPLKVATSGTSTAFPSSSSDAIILVETNSSGVVTSVIRVHKGGLGHTSGSGHVTSQRGYWVLLRINTTGEVPIYTNPQHFIRPGDLHGQNTRFILDGLGMPIAEDEDAGTITYYPYDEGNLLLLGIPLSIDT